MSIIFEIPVIVQLHGSVVHFQRVHNGGLWHSKLEEAVPELKSTEPITVRLIFEVKRKSGWYWVKLKRWTSYLPCFYDTSIGVWFYGGNRLSDSDLLDMDIKETRIPEPTDG